MGAGRFSSEQDPDCSEEVNNIGRIYRGDL